MAPVFGQDLQVGCPFVHNPFSTLTLECLMMQTGEAVNPLPLSLGGQHVVQVEAPDGMTPYPASLAPSSPIFLWLCMPVCAGVDARREMDGFDAAGKRAVVIGATNRKVDLDPALMSRFDLVSARVRVLL